MSLLERLSGDGSTGSIADPSDLPSWVRGVVRVGWIGKGLVFALMGVIAIRVATFTWREDLSVSQEGALRSIAAQPFGALLLFALAAALVLFAAWNIGQAALHDDAESPLVLSLIKRIGWFGLGTFYGIIAAGSVSLAWRELDDPAAGTQTDTSTGTSDTGEATDWAVLLFELPAGRAVAVLVSVVVLAVAAYHVKKGLRGEFLDDIETDDLGSGQRSAARIVGAIGFVGRSVALASVAVLLARAAIDFDPDEAVGLDAALRQLSSSIPGRVFVGAVGVSLVIAGAYDMATFRRQRLD